MNAHDVRNGADVLTEGGCAACHAQPLSAMAVSLARERSWTEAAADADVQQITASLAATSQNLLQVREAGGTLVPYQVEVMPRHGMRVLPVSARSSEALSALTQAWHSWCGEAANVGTDIADLCASATDDAEEDVIGGWAFVGDVESKPIAIERKRSRNVVHDEER